MRHSSHYFYWPRMGALFALPIFLYASTALAATSSSSGGLALRIFEVLLGIIAAGLIALLGYGYYLHSTGNGDLLQTSQGKKFMLAGGIGGGIALIILILLLLIGSRAQNGQQTTETSIDTATTAGFSSKMGEFSKIASHFPARDEKNVARNAVVLIQFTEPVLIGSIVDQQNVLKPESIAIQVVGGKGSSKDPSVTASAELTQEGTILKITPTLLLGKPNEKTMYGITLKGGLQKEGGDSLFGNTGNYSWQFEVSGIIDNAPPTIDSVLPAPISRTAGVAVPKNNLIQITFNEPIDPSAVSGGKIEVMDETAHKIIEGGMSIGNNFRTLTFVPRTVCGKNACRETMYCMPANAAVKVTLKSARLQQQRNPETPYRAKSPYDGIVDTAGNSFDGGGESGVGKNGKSEGPPTDNFYWSYTTNDAINVNPPQITRIAPGRDTTQINPTTPIQIDFSTFMDATTLHSSSIVLGRDVNYWVQTAHDVGGKKSGVTIQHDPLMANTLYAPEVRADARDIFQNCYNPCRGPVQ